MSRAVVLLVGIFLSFSVVANCDINLDIKNTGERTFEFHNQWESQVKVKGGLWRALNSNGWLPDETYFTIKPGEKRGDILNGLFNCGAKRRYKVTYRCKYGQYANRTFVKYFPSSTEWTTKQSPTIKIRKCKL